MVMRNMIMASMSDDDVDAHVAGDADDCDGDDDGDDIIYRYPCCNTMFIALDVLSPRKKTA